MGLEQGRDGNSIPKEEKNLRYRTLYEKAIREEYKKRWSMSAGKLDILQYANIDAIFENYFRDRIKERGISVSEEDLFKLIEAFDTAAEETKKYVFGKIREELDHMPP